MKCNKCDSDMKKFFEENLYVPCKSYFITEDGEMVSLYVCPKCGKVQGELAADSPRSGLPACEASWKAPKKNGRTVRYF